MYSEGFHGQIEFTDNHRAFTRRLEEMLSEVSHREIGGFGTSDTDFAFKMGELIRTMLTHMDHVDETIDQAMSEYQTTIDSREDEIGILAKKLDRIEDWVKDHRRLQNVIDIINEDQF